MNKVSGNVKTSPNQQVTSKEYLPVNNSSVTFTLEKESKVLISSGIDSYFIFTSSNLIGTGEVGMSINGNNPVKSTLKRAENKDNFILGGHMSTSFMQTIETLPAGENTISLVSRIDDTNSESDIIFVVFTADITYAVID